jgi:hypothetical protein
VQWPVTMQKTLRRGSVLTVPLIVLGCGGDTPGKPLPNGDEPEDAGGSAVVTGGPGVTRDTGTTGGGGANSVAPASDGGGALPSANGFSVQIQNSEGVAITSAMLDCADDCIDVRAVAQGGNPPYSFAWEDGSTAAERKLCPSASTTFSVIASDTPVEAVELAQAAQTASGRIAALVPTCTDAGVAAVAQCKLAPGPKCELARGVVLPEDLTVDVPGASIRYFAGGAPLPAGRYRLSYVDGCNTYGIFIGWTVHGAKAVPGVFSCSLIGADDAAFAFTPGTELYPETGVGEVASYAECVAANCDLAPLDFDFPGGKLGVLRDGGGTLGAIDDLGGESEGGRSPTFRLTLLDACP